MWWVVLATLDIAGLLSGDAMKTVKITEILDYYDGILAFAAQDPIGGHYVGSTSKEPAKTTPT